MKSLIILLLSFGFTFTAAQTAAAPVFADSLWGPYDTLEEIQELAGHRFEIWRNSNNEFYMGMALRSISPSGEVIEIEEAVISLVRSEGDDLNQNGIPDLMIEMYSGGAHCCFTSSLIELSDPANMVFEQAFSECPASPVDLDGDGIAEFTSCDDIWAYAYCSYAESPLPPVAWKWNGERYEIANREFPQLYDDDIRWAFTYFLELQAEQVDWTPTPECSALALTLPYLYMGKQDLAYQALKLSYTPDQLYDDAIFASFDTVDEFWQSILETYNSSALRTP